MLSLIQLSKKDKSKVICRNEANSMYVTKPVESCGIMEVALSIDKFKIKKFSRIGDVFKAMRRILHPVQIEKTDPHDLVSNIQLYRNQIAVANRRGAGNCVVVNSKTYHLLYKMGIIFDILDMFEEVEIDESVSDREMLLMYLSGASVFDRFIYSWGWWIFKRFAFIPDKTKANAKLLII